MSDWISKDLDIHNKRKEQYTKMLKDKEEHEKQAMLKKKLDEGRKLEPKNELPKETVKDEEKEDKKEDKKVDDKKSDKGEAKKEEKKEEKTQSLKVEEKEVHEKLEEKPVEHVRENPQSPQEELEANLLKFRDEVLNSTDHDLKNSDLYISTKAGMSSAIDAGFVSDTMAIDVFKKNVKEYDHESWLLEGFPKTRHQALALSKNKVIPDKIFLMKYSDDIAIEHILGQLKEKYEDEVDEEELIKVAQEAMREYHMHIKDVHDLFKNVIHIIDCHGYVKGYSDEQNKVSHFVDELSRLIQMKRMSPDRRLRVIIVGPPGSGRSTQAISIAKKYGLVHVSTSNLLKNEIRLKTERGKRIKECFNNSKLVPDEIICSLIEARIKQQDCKLNGWVLDGFPKTIQQITVLKAMKIKPTRVIILECDKSVCSDRILNRHFDPVTGKIYNMMDQIPTEQDIKNRIVPYFPDMTKEKVEKRWDIWNQFQIKVEDSYQDLVLKFNTEEYGADHVTEHICEFLQNPLY